MVLTQHIQGQGLQRPPSPSISVPSLQSHFPKPEVPSKSFSKNVQARLKKYLNVEAEVLYPPCDTEGFEWMGEGDYFLSTARLEPLKRVDLIVKAFKKFILSKSF